MLLMFDRNYTIGEENIWGLHNLRVLVDVSALLKSDEAVSVHTKRRLLVLSCMFEVKTLVKIMRREHDNSL